MVKRYNPKDIEPKWQAAWAESKIYEATEDQSELKRYVLEYFPYPSGAAMHVGHVRNYAIGDLLSRFYRMQGENVLHPMGWDSFGLPAENYAIKHNISPKQAIAENTSKFKQQLTQMGFSYDWSREIDSSDPAYYRWTQWFFKLLFDRGLAYQKDSLQWWCETDKTVLANEQVEAGKCWRCGNEVTKKPLKQWFFKITDYADRLVADLDNVDWPDAIKTMQRNWIGRSIGAEVDFPVCHPELDSGSNRSARSYIMGQKNITAEDVESLGGTIAKITNQGYLCVSFPISSANAFEQLIIDKMEPGFWNEYLTVESTVFIFKHKDGKTERFVLSDDTNDTIRKLGNMFNNREDDPSERVEDWLKNNEWYKDWILNQVQDDKGESKEKITVFTTRPDTLFGATFMVLAPEHQLVQQITTPSQLSEVEAYIKQAQAKSDVERQETDREKTGVFTGAYVTNPVNGEKIPVWIADYVLLGYGTGAIMAVPAHDERDYEFAQKFELPITRVVQNDAADDECSHDEGTMMNSGAYDGMASQDAREKIVADLAKDGVAAEKVNYKIRDWLISRQRYWGAPIPIIHCPEHGAVPVPADQLPVALPELTNFQPTGKGSALAGATDWVNTTCPTCDGPAKRETDTMDGFACSSWYFLRFADPHNDTEPFAQDKVKFWLPVDDYIGGAEHAVMHLLYARMWTKVMHDAGLIDFDEPFKSLRNQGMILAPDGRKMSKSWGNVIAPDDIIEQGYGADAIRIMELFIGPWNQSAAWSVEGMGGCYRFLQRVWTITQEFLEQSSQQQPANQPDIQRHTHQTIKKVTEDIHDMGFNTAISALMEFTNGLYKAKADSGFADRKAWQAALEALVQLLAPFAPHITEELWRDLGHDDSVHLTNWPEWDEAQLVSDTITVVVQVNGKVRATISVAADASQADIVAAAKADDKVAAHVADQPIRKEIYVPGKLVNLVV